MLIVSSFVCLFAFVSGLQKEGDSCVSGYAYSAGVCTKREDCHSAKVDYEKSGIQPTWCTYSTFGPALLCCRDGHSIVQPVDHRWQSERPPIWGPAETRRVSERKCEEYSNGVTEIVQYIPLIPEPETLSVTTAKCDYEGIYLILGGKKADQGEFPHMAAIGWASPNGYSFKCGGSLISPRFVLSAGHCIRASGLEDPVPSIVRLGDQNINNKVYDGAEPVDVPIRNIIPHPDYKSPIKYNDIALFELATDVSFQRSIRPACLWSKPDLRGYSAVVATGWGVVDTNTRKPSEELQKVSLSIIDNEKCDELLIGQWYRNWNGTRPTQMCAGELKGGMDTCQGDSGSPLQVASLNNQCIYHIVGITSFGFKCGERDKPGLYTRVSSYIDWIESVVWPGEI